MGGGEGLSPFPRAWAALAGVVACAVLAFAAPAVAAPCPAFDDSYLDTCGPTFQIPSWTDSGGWDDPSQYATITLADVNGDGADELLGRSDAGIEVFRFDTTLGQWRFQVDARRVPQLLDDFATFLPAQDSDPRNPAHPQFSSTIQTADVDGTPGEEVIARFWDGMRVYRYTRAAGGRAVDGGTWTRIGTGGPFTDAGGYADPSLYTTIRTADIDGDGADELLGRSTTGVVSFDWTASGWTPGPALPAFADADCADPACYLDFRTGTLTGSGPEVLIGRDGAGVSSWGIGDGAWQRLDPSSAANATFSDGQGSRDCGFDDGGDGTNDCLGTAPAYYETLGLADIDGVPGEELLARASDGLRVRSYAGEWVTYDDTSSAIDFGFGWTAKTGVAGNIDQTEHDAASNATPLTFSFTGTAVQVIGPLDPGLGTSYFWLDDPLWFQNDPDGIFSQEDPSRMSQVVMFNRTDLPYGPHQVVMQAQSNPAGVDAIKVLPGPWVSLPTLDDLGGAAADLTATPGAWGSIRTGDIDGRGGDEVLALDADGLQAWTYDASTRRWTKLAPTTPLALGSDPWLTDPAYYSTIQTGDVDGDGRDEVIARGPSGVRTWAYDRRGTGGWERYLAEGYPAFESEGAQNEANAFTALNALAIQKGLIPAGSLRDLWSSEIAPQPGDLTRLINGLAADAGCGAPIGSPPQVASCTPPAGSTGFTATQWTAVVNQMLVEADAAGEVLAYLTDLTTLRNTLFLQENAELPAIGSELGLQAAAANTGEFNPLTLMSGTLGIAASIAGLLPGVGPELSAGLWVAAEATSMIPQTSPTATSSAFPSTYAGLQGKFASMVSETEKGLTEMSQDIRQDAGLIQLVSQLREDGPWATTNLDTVGMQSAANQAFAIWVYKALVPTVYDRYDITVCAEYGNALCYGPAAGTPGIVGGETDPNVQDAFDFIGIGPQRDLDGGTPCKNDEQDVVPDCTYTEPPTALGNAVWGAPDAACAYVPGKVSTAWTFGCNAGVGEASSIGENTWNFTTYSGAFDVSASHCGWPYGGGCGAAPPPAAGRRAAASTAQSRPAGRPVVLSRPRAGRRAGSPGLARFRTAVSVPRGTRLAGAPVVLDRVLFEPGARELTGPRARRGQQPLRLTLRRAAPGRFVATGGGRRPVRVDLRLGARRPAGRGATLTVTASRLYHTPRACRALPAAAAIDTAPVRLHSRLVIGAGRDRLRIDVRHDVRCRRDGRGVVDRLEYVPPPPRRPSRPGLALTLRGPGAVTPGAAARYTARVSNVRRGGTRIVSSLWDVTLVRGRDVSRIRELPRGRARSVPYTVRVPRDARGRFCVVVTATAGGARGDAGRVCSRVTSR